MKTNSTSKQWISGICILTLISGMTLHSPVAHADDFGAVCSAIVQRVANGEKVQNDMKAGKCVEADLAGKSAAWATRKSIIQLSAAAVTGYQYIQERIGKKKVKVGSAKVADGQKKIAQGISLKEKAALMAPGPAKVFMMSSGIALQKGGEGLVSVGTNLISDGAAKITRARTVCPITAITAGAGTFAIDMFGKYKINQVKTKYGQQQEPIFDANKLMAVAIPVGLGMMGDKSAMKMPELIMNKADFMNVQDAICTAATPCDGSIASIEQMQANTDAELKKKSACLGTAMAMGAMGALSVIEKDNLEELRKTNIDLAKKVTIESGKGITSISMGDVGSDQKISKSSAVSVQRTESASCEKASGNAYLNCALAQVPETAAVINNSRLKNAIESRIGKNLGDFAKGYQGKSNADLVNYVANATGVSGSALSEFLRDSQKSGGGSLSDQPLAEESSDSSPRYSSASGASLLGSKSGDMDLDFNKMMSGLLGNLNGNPADSEKKGSPAEAVFRRMDLLPADQIQANKDISLFARIAYRYRKKSDKLDPTLKTEIERTISSERK
jgi:hypothetical protein